MTFALDRDLLAACPELLDDVTWAGQTTLDETNATLSAGTLTLSSGSFTDAGVAEGSVLLVAGVPREVVAVASATVCSVSLVRARDDDDPVAGPDAAAADVVARTFAPQREAAYAAVLSALGIDLDRSGAQDLVDGILSVGLMRRLEVFKTLETMYALAPIPGTAGTAASAEGIEKWRQRSAFYRGRFAEVFFHARVAFDLDGDGEAEQERALNVLPTVRV